MQRISDRFCVTITTEDLFYWRASRYNIHRNVADWLVENVGREGDTWSVITLRWNREANFYFDKEEDAIHFKMVWE